jgi:L-methionine (R)-S-oxide reductase
MHDPARPAPWMGPETHGRNYRDLLDALAALLEGEPDPLANLANAAAAIFYSLPELNWAGFYLLRGDDLVLGPFQGRPACVRIPPGRGVCGTAAREGRTILVPDVNAYPAHIVCGPGSRSELVAPLRVRGRVVGVLDLDSPRLGRFGPPDQDGCALIADLVAPCVEALASSR